MIFLSNIQRSDSERAVDHRCALYLTTAMFFALACVGCRDQPEVLTSEQMPSPIAAKPMEFDWSLLPSELSYLADAAKRYEHLGTELLIVNWLHQANDEELDQLAAFGKRYSADYDEIEKWQEKHDGSDEQFAVYWLGMILDHADMLDVSENGTEPP